MSLLPRRTQDGEIISIAGTIAADFSRHHQSPSTRICLWLLRRLGILRSPSKATEAFASCYKLWCARVFALGLEFALVLGLTFIVTEKHVIVSLDRGRCLSPLSTKMRQCKQQTKHWQFSREIISQVLQKKCLESIRVSITNNNPLNGKTLEWNIKGTSQKL